MEQHVAVSGTSDAPAPTFASTREELDGIRKGLEFDPLTGKHVKRAQHLVHRDAYTTTKGFFLVRGEFFVAGPNPYYLDKVDHKLILMSPDDPEFAKMFRNLGLLANEPHTRIVTKTLVEFANSAPRKTAHGFAHMTQDNMIYIRVSDTRMFKITPTDITEVPTGTDDVVLLSDDLGVWPSLEELVPHVNNLRDIVGNTTTAPVAGSPLSKLTSRWETGGHLTSAQHDELLLTRLLFLFAADRCRLWPLFLNTGSEGAGKSTPFELALSCFRGSAIELTNFPDRQQDFIATITNSPLLVFDNADGTGLHRPEKSPYSDLICQVSTGAEVTMRRLYANNKLDRHKLRGHVFFTSRNNPFDRPDVMRRMIHLELAPPEDESEVTKDRLIKRVLDDRLRMLAEFLLRAQNITRAYAAYGDAEYRYQTQMKEYEHFTLVCAQYGGTLKATHALWSAYMAKHTTRLTQDNSLISVLRLWLGKSGNANRQVSPTTLHAELKALTEELRVNFSYKAASTLGKIMGHNQTPLRAIGWSEVRTKSGRDYIFNPSASELAIAQKQYGDAREAANKFLIASTSRFPRRPAFEPEGTTISEDDLY